MIPDPRSGELTITHRQEGDSVVYTASQTFTRELLLGLVGGKRVFISMPAHRATPDNQDVPLSPIEASVPQAKP